MHTTQVLDTKLQSLIRLDLVTMLTVCGDSKTKLIRLFFYILNPNNGLDSLAVLLYRKYLNQLDAFKVTRRNYIINRKNTEKGLRKECEQIVYEYILAACSRSVYDFNVTGENGIDLETHGDVIDTCHNLYNSKHIYVYDNKMYLAYEK